MQPRHVEKLFIRVGVILELRVAGRSIKTTVEHPFYVHGKGWQKAGTLEQGDMLRTRCGGFVTVDAVESTNEITTVYNMRVEEYHTYFVGDDSWGFSVEAHNAGGHYAGWSLFDASNELLNAGEEFSGLEFSLGSGQYLTWYEQALYGHTEGKILLQLFEDGELSAGRLLEIAGELNPCQNCQRIMQQASEAFGMRITYENAAGQLWAWANGVLVLGSV